MPSKQRREKGSCEYEQGVPLGTSHQDRLLLTHVPTRTRPESSPFPAFPRIHSIAILQEEFFSRQQNLRFSRLPADT